MVEEENKKDMKRTYKNCEKQHIGDSDISTLVLVGCRGNEVVSETLHFGEDSSYSAYIVDEDVLIGEHYKKVATFSKWLKIYDDCGLAYTTAAKTINVYRAKEMGCIIQLVNSLSYDELIDKYRIENGYFVKDGREYILMQQAYHDGRDYTALAVCVQDEVDKTGLQKCYIVTWNILDDEEDEFFNADWHQPDDVEVDGYYNVLEGVHF